MMARASGALWIGVRSLQELDEISLACVTVPEILGWKRRAGRPVKVSPTQIDPIDSVANMETNKGRGRSELRGPGRVESTAPGSRSKNK